VAARAAAAMVAGKAAAAAKLGDPGETEAAGKVEATARVNVEERVGTKATVATLVGSVVGREEVMDPAALAVEEVAPRREEMGAEMTAVGADWVRVGVAGRMVGMPVAGTAAGTTVGTAAKEKGEARVGKPVGMGPRHHGSTARYRQQIHPLPGSRLCR